MSVPTIDDLRSAHELIRSHIHRTPIFTSEALNERFGCEFFFKCENLQKAGAFKSRGACNAVFSLSEQQTQSGVVTHSSGNHAAALARAAKLRGMPAHIVMPNNAPAIKVAAVKNYGGAITFCEPTQHDRETTAESIRQQTGAEMIHPYNDPRIIAGQGTAALELLDDVTDLDVIIAPVGGGGLLSGTAIAAKSQVPSVKVYGAEPKALDDAHRSFQSGDIQPATGQPSLADGLKTSLGTLTFPIIQQHVDEIFLASEASIVHAMRMVWERMKLIIEPSAAVPLAVLLEDENVLQNHFAGRRVGVIFSGGNVDLAKLPFTDAAIER